MRRRRAREHELNSIVAELEELVARRAASTKPRHSGRRLGALLLTRGYLVQSELDYALARQAATGRRLGEVVVELGLVPEHVVVELIAEQLRIDVLETARVVPEPNTGRLLTEADARRLGALPLRHSDGWFSVAVADPTRPHLVVELAQLLHGPVRILATTHDVLEELIQRAYAPSASRSPGL
jgi:hypothetical protein